MLSKRFALHLLRQGTNRIERMLLSTNSIRRAQHLALQYARCHPGERVMLADRHTVNLEKQEVYYREGQIVNQEMV